jgi:hexosaminidase
MMLVFRILIGVLFVSSTALAHSPLLPRPQQIRYGPGKLPLTGLNIRLSANAAGEDRFAATELAAILSARCSTPVRIAENSNGSQTSIVLKRTGAVGDLPLPGERPGPDSREAYRLTIRPDGGVIEASSSAGLYYAVQTVRQLVEGSEGSAVLPEVEVRDWPSLAYRGTMIDVSHGPLPTEGEVKRQLDFLARWKANQYYIYSEGAIELDGYPLLNPEGRFSKDQIKRIIAYGRERHIDVIPFLELYGHLHDLLRIELYSGLGAFPHSVELDPTNPKVGSLLADWAAQISDLFPSPFVHVGFDETWRIEDVAKKRGNITPAELFAEQLGNVAKLFQQHGKTVMAWADVVVKYPAIINRLPRGVIPVAWDYDAEPNVKKWLDPLAAKHLPHFVQSGVANWQEIALNFDMTFANIDNFLAAGRRSAALGLINSVWADSAQCFLRLTWPAMAYGAIAPWQSVPMPRATFFSEYSAQMYAASAAPEVAQALENLNQSEVAIEKVFGQPSIHEMWGDPFSAMNLKRTADHHEDLRQTRLAAEMAQTHIYRAMKESSDVISLKTLLVAGQMLDFAGYKFLNALEVAERWRTFGPYNSERYWNEIESEIVYVDHGRLADMMDEATQIARVYRAAWLAEYTPYRLGAALGRWQNEYTYWLRLQNRFRSVTEGSKEGSSLPPLESVIGLH